MVKLEQTKEYVEDPCRVVQAFRIVEISKGGPRTLFHGVQGSRLLPFDRWLDAEQRWVRDGTGPYYWSGFNVLREREELELYMDRFTAPRELRIVPVFVSGLRKKVHSRAPVFLADKMFLSSGERI